MYFLQMFEYFKNIQKKRILKKYYKIFNNLYFDNSLPKIPLIINNVENSETDGLINYGCFSYTIDYGNMELIPLYIKISKKLLNDSNKFDLFRDTLVHEMVHFYEICNNKPTEEEWYRALNSINQLNTSIYAYNYIRKGPRGGHNKFFKDKCHELNEKYPELNLREVENSDRL